VNMPGNWELILILLVVVIVFGAKRLPDSARALGRSMRILKAETKGLRDDDAGSSTTAKAVTPGAEPVEVRPVPPVQAQPYAGQQLFDADGRPVQAPAGLNGSHPNGSNKVQQAPSAQA
jgi:sec-independent protein translocase protein TatA